MRLLPSLAAIVAAVAAALALPAAAGGYRTVAWSDLKPLIFGAREVDPAGPSVALSAPYRALDDRRVPVDVSARMTDGSLIRSVTLVIDENPMPVSAVFELATPRAAVRLGADMRLNGPSPVRAVIETTDGRLLMAEQLVKTSGLGACAAPPMGRPDEAIAAIGRMEARPLAPAGAPLAPLAPLASSAPRMAELAMRHPQHTGMQIDQISLLPILARYVETVELWDGEARLLTLTGSISLSEDPAIRFEMPGDETARLRVRMTDTDAMVIERELSLLPEG